MSQQTNIRRIKEIAQKSAFFMIVPSSWRSTSLFATNHQYLHLCKYAYAAVPWYHYYLSISCWQYSSFMYAHTFFMLQNIQNHVADFLYAEQHLNNRPLPALTPKFCLSILPSLHCLCRSVFYPKTQTFNYRKFNAKTIECATAVFAWFAKTNN